MRDGGAAYACKHTPPMPNHNSCFVSFSSSSSSSSSFSLTRSLIFSLSLSIPLSFHERQALHFSIKSISSCFSFTRACSACFPSLCWCFASLAARKIYVRHAVPFSFSLSLSPLCPPLAFSSTSSSSLFSSPFALVSAHGCDCVCVYTCVYVCVCMCMCSSVYICMNAVLGATAGGHSRHH
jgi:hypothetical protein